jgi:hypothetical protein
LLVALSVERLAGSALAIADLTVHVGEYARRRGGGQGDAEVPVRVGRIHCTPNVTTGGTLVRYHLDRSSVVRLDVYDVTGKRVSSLARAALPGQNTIFWDGTDNPGRQVPPGTYVCRLVAGDDVRSTVVRVIR